jgi:DNA-binding NarL/FixJ family response regulator
LAWELTAPTVVLDTDLSGESGWLTCVKLTRDNPQLRVILVAPVATPDRRRFALFVGATGLVGRNGGPVALVEEVCGVPLPTGG